MKKNHNIVFTLCLLVYILTKSIRYFKLSNSDFVNYYLTDLVCIPLVLYSIKWIVTRLNIYKDLKQIPIIAVFAVTLYWSLYFEYYLPSKSAMHTGDNYDVLMYFIGGAFFLLIQEIMSTNFFRELKESLTSFKPFL